MRIILINNKLNASINMIPSTPPPTATRTTSRPTIPTDLYQLRDRTADCRRTTWMTVTPPHPKKSPRSYRITNHSFWVKQVVHVILVYFSQPVGACLRPHTRRVRPLSRKPNHHVKQQPIRQSRKENKAPIMKSRLISTTHYQHQTAYSTGPF